jgi:hypothetical protein
VLRRGSTLGDREILFPFFRILFEAGAQYNGSPRPYCYSVKMATGAPRMAAAEKPETPKLVKRVADTRPLSRRQAGSAQTGVERCMQRRRSAMTLAEQGRRRYAPGLSESWFQPDQSSSGKGADQCARPPLQQVEKDLFIGPITAGP